MSNHGRADTLSLNSTMSCSSLSQDPLSSRSSSYTSLNESQSPMVSPISCFSCFVNPSGSCWKLIDLNFHSFRPKRKNVRDLRKNRSRETRKRWLKTTQNGATERDDGMSLARNVRQDYFAVKITNKNPKCQDQQSQRVNCSETVERRCHLGRVNGAAPLYALMIDNIVTFNESEDLHFSGAVIFGSPGFDLCEPRRKIDAAARANAFTSGHLTSAPAEQNISYPSLNTQRTLRRDWAIQGR
jgi:hypothetical protein